MTAQHAEIFKLLPMRLQYGQRRGWCGGLKTNGKEDDLALRVVTCDLQGIERRINHANVATARLRFHQRQTPGTGYTQGVAVSAKNHALIKRQTNRHIDPANRQHAHRATGAVHHAHIGWQQIGEAIARNGVGVAAAKFHKAVAAARLDAGCNLAGKSFCNLAIAELVDVFHATAASTADSVISENNASVRSASSGSNLDSA